MHSVLRYNNEKKTYIYIYIHITALFKVVPVLVQILWQLRIGYFIDLEIQENFNLKFRCNSSKHTVVVMIVSKHGHEDCWT